MDQPWADWVVGQKVERRGQDEGTGVVESPGSQLGESVGGRVKRRLTVNDQERL